jgi:hypothetical protein
VRSAEAPYFVDYGAAAREAYQGLTTNTTEPVEVHDADLHLQRLAPMRCGRPGRRRQALARRKRTDAEAALIAVDPKSGDIPALVGAFTTSHAQPGRDVTTAAGSYLGLPAWRRAAAGAARPTSRLPRSGRQSDDWETIEGLQGMVNKSDDGPVTWRPRSPTRATSPRSKWPSTGFDKAAASGG